MPKGTTSSPLVEPDVRISLIRLSQKRSVDSMRRQLHGVRSEVPQAHSLVVLVSRDPFRRLKGPLAAPSQVLPKTEKDMAVDLIESVAGIAEAEVVRPASQVSIQLCDQDRDRLPTLRLAGHLPQLLPFSLQRLLRRRHVQIAPRPHWLRSYRNVNPRKSRLAPFCFRSTTRVFSRLISSPIQVSNFASINPSSFGLT